MAMALLAITFNQIAIPVLVVFIVMLLIFAFAI